MKTKNLVLVLGFAAASLLVASQALSGDEHAGKQPSPEEMAKAMAEWMKLSAPSDYHKHLESMIGTWDTAHKMWWGGPGTPANESKGVSEVTWTLGRRFMREEIKSEFPMPREDGQMQNVSFTGIGYTGFDNYRKMYVGSWMDNMGTQMLGMKGAVDPSGKVFTFYGEMDEPMLNVHGRLVKYVTRVINNDKHVFEMYDLHAGDDYKVMEIVYTRR